jgi:pimeloyl-ACP methyl ester carboxylesterase
MGGPVVLEAARRMSNDRLTAVIPVDSLHDADALHVPETVEEALGDFRRDFAAATSKLVRERLFIPSSDPALVERVARHASSMSPDIGFSALREAWVYDARPALREIGAPIRAINTDLFPTNVDANRRYAPQYDVVIMRGVGHYPMLEDPEGFNRALEGVLHDVIAQESR